MKRLLIAGVVVLGAVAQAAAADLPQPAPPPAQAPVAYIPVVPVYNWGGIYYGINGGYAFGKSEWTTPLATTGNFNTSGFAVGATVGANYQVDAFVFGLEADIDWMGVKGSSSICTPACETKNTWLSTFRGRAGYAADRVLFYATGGGAFGNIQAGASGSSLTNANKAGWTAGAGIEAALADNWTARVEYLFVDFQNATPFTLVTVKLNENLIRFGLDYKFR
jgi:outer membrane immunogenic protein